MAGMGTLNEGIRLFLRDRINARFLQTTFIAVHHGAHISTNWNLFFLWSTLPSPEYLLTYLRVSRLRVSLSIQKQRQSRSFIFAFLRDLGSKHSPTSALVSTRKLAKKRSLNLVDHDIIYTTRWLTHKLDRFLKYAPKLIGAVWSAKSTLKPFSPEQWAKFHYFSAVNEFDDLIKERTYYPNISGTVPSIYQVYQAELIILILYVSIGTQIDNSQSQCWKEGQHLQYRMLTTFHCSGRCQLSAFCCWSVKNKAGNSLKGICEYGAQIAF